MTLLQIYNRVCFYVYGDTTPPTSVETNLKGTTGIISNIHRRIQEEYSYWFMETWGTYSITSGVQSYTLPTGFKEEVNLMFKDGTTGDFYEPMQKLGTGEDHRNFWKSFSNQVTYPTHYMIIDDTFVIYPAPNSSQTLHLVYYEFLTRIGSDSDTDDLTQNGYDAIIQLAIAELCEVLKETTMADRARAKGLQHIEELKLKDQRYRRSRLNYTLYGDL